MEIGIHRRAEDPTGIIDEQNRFPEYVEGSCVGESGDDLAKRKATKRQPRIEKGKDYGDYSNAGTNAASQLGEIFLRSSRIVTHRLAHAMW